jgi:hypothetical protein
MIKTNQFSLPTLFDRFMLQLIFDLNVAGSIVVIKGIKLGNESTKLIALTYFNAV